METSLCANNAAVAGNDTTARELGGIESWIATNDVMSAAGSPASPTGKGSNARTVSYTHLTLPTTP